MIDGRNYCDQLVKNDLQTHDNIKNIDTGQGDGYMSGCLLYYSYFKELY